MLTWPAAKDPNEVKDYSLDWSDLLGGDDTITASTWTVSGTGVMIDESSFTDTATTVWLSAGTLGATYNLLNRVTTSGGRTYDQTARLRIQAK
ncbi:hypothetical protein GOC46_30410 [Sinorhizobium meliloti]|nr:hypothetical protein [Sinorhizobium meliloti]MDX0384425.1 hypothetical protein [Sinorhizobium meliloti]